MAQKVRIIPPTINRATSAPVSEVRKRRVAGYARVSTEQEEQQSSYEAQVSYYTDYIKGRDDWEFVRVYTDDGISATSTLHREGFQAMVADALAGRIDLIVTKSVSRFARNTVDSLTTIRKLKEHGTEVYFEKENIWTLDSKGELLLTIMSSLAQEESRSISENVRWGQRKKFNDGRFSLNYKHFLGYDKGPDGGLVINEEQARIVRRIFGEFLSGMSPYAIARGLTADGIPSPAGKPRWNDLTIRRVLSNETYKGDKLLQKTYSNDFLDKTRRKNHGEVPQVYVEGCHEAIIPEATFNRVQREIERRKGCHNSGGTIFSTKIFCVDCGQMYGPKVWHSNDPAHRRVIWQCNSKFDGQRCKTPHLTENEIKEAFVIALNRLLTIREEVIRNLREIQTALADTTAQETEVNRLTGELEVIAELLQQMIDQNARTAQDQSDYQRRYDELASRYQETDAALQAARGALSQAQSRNRQIADFIAEVDSLPGAVTEFSADYWGHLVEKVTVVRKKEMTFPFSCGVEIRV